MHFISKKLLSLFSITWVYVVESDYIIVTGGAGYIGSHTCKTLHQSGYIPVVMDDLSSGSKEFVKWGPLEEGNILDKDWIFSVFDKYHPKAVMHFAAKISVDESINDPLSYYHVNFSGSLNLLDAIRHFKVKIFIFSSSCSVYGNPINIPVDETHPLNPLCPYARTKLFFEEALKDCSKAYGFNYGILRYFNAAGCDKDMESGFTKDNKSFISIATKASLERKPLNIFGNDYDTRDGTCIRDFIHVADLADAHVLTLNHIIKKNESLLLNLGSEKGYSIKEVVQELQKISENYLGVLYGPKRDGDIVTMIADSTKAKNTLNWTAQHNLEDILQTSYQWQKKITKD